MYTHDRLGETKFAGLNIKILETNNWIVAGKRAQNKKIVELKPKHDLEHYRWMSFKPSRKCTTDSYIGKNSAQLWRNWSETENGCYVCTVLTHGINKIYLGI